MKVIFAFILFFPAVSGLAANFSVREFGAKGNKVANDTAAIQAAVDACNRSGGGEVIVPPGNYFAGGIVLKSDVTLLLENGATIWASGRIEDYRNNPIKGEHAYLFEADGQENIIISGDGKIVGTGQGDLGRRAGKPKAAPPSHRFGIILFTRCKNVRLRDFEIRDSEAHAVVLKECEEVFVDHLSNLNNFFRVNTDGIDPVSCTNVLISNCHIVAGDDCICLKTENGKPLVNVVVDNCILESVAAAFKLGTASSGDFRHIQVSNLIIRNSGVGLGLFIKDGGIVEDVSFSNISIETTRQGVPIKQGLRNTIFPIYIDLTKRNADSPLSRIRDVSFDDIQIESDNSIVIQGMPQREVDDVTLHNITFRLTGGFDFSHRIEREGGTSHYSDTNKTHFVREPAYLTVAHVNGLTVDDVRVVIPGNLFKRFPRSALAVFGSENGVIENVRRGPTESQSAPPIVALRNCNGIELQSEKRAQNQPGERSKTSVTPLASPSGAQTSFPDRGPGSNGAKIYGSVLCAMSTPGISGSNE